MGTNNSRIPIKSKNGLSPEASARAQAHQAVGKRSGVYGKAIDEPVPTLEMVDSERLIGRGENNSFIILGRDRPAHARSGEGGKGATQCGRIDLIVGLGSSYKRKDGTIGPPDENTVLNPNFALDAARIYVSQKTDLDRYMGIALGYGDLPTVASGIGLKADTIRIHSRHDVKIVTGRSRLAGLGKNGETLADGTVNDRVGTISFIAGNYNEPQSVKHYNMLNPKNKKSASNLSLQPLVKGNNLIKCLDEVAKVMSQLKSQIDNHQTEIKQLSQDFIAHVHPFPVGPAPQAMAGGAVVYGMALAQDSALAALSKTIENFKVNHLDPKGGGFINSSYVFTT